MVVPKFELSCKIDEILVINRKCRYAAVIASDYERVKVDVVSRRIRQMTWNIGIQF